MQTPRGFRDRPSGGVAGPQAAGNGLCGQLRGMGASHAGEPGHRGPQDPMAGPAAPMPQRLLPFQLVAFTRFAHGCEQASRSHGEGTKAVPWFVLAPDGQKLDLYRGWIRVSAVPSGRVTRGRPGSRPGPVAHDHPALQPESAGSHPGPPASRP